MNKIMQKSALTTSALLAGMTVGMSLSQQRVHADNAPTAPSETTQNSPEQQLSSLKQSNDQQLQNLTSENAKTETTKQHEINQNIQAVQTQTEQQMAKNDQQISQNKQTLHEQDHQALNRETESINAGAQKQVSAENTSYNQSVSAQTAANQSSEDASAKQNAQTLQEASKHIVTPAQKDALTKDATDQYNAGKQAAEQQFTDATTKANSDHQTKLNSLNSAKQSDVNNAQAKHEQDIKNQQQANDQAIANAQHAYNEAVANAPKISNAVKPATPATSLSDLTDGSRADPEGFNSEEKPYYPIAHVARWNQMPDYWFKNPDAMKVSSKDQLPMDFKPGIILYDAANDHSEKIASTGLTEDQERELNTLSNHWLNQVRHYFWDNLQIQKTNPNAKISGYDNPKDRTQGLTVKDFAPQAPIHDLFTPNEYWEQVGQSISYGREKYGTNYAHTTGEANNKFTLQDHNQTGWNNDTGTYSSVILFWSSWTTAYNDSALDGSLYDPETNGSKLDSLATGENLYKINGNTMLEMEVCLYNKLQELTYGEYQGQISNTAKTPLIGGHLANVLNPKFQFVTMAFQNATTDPTFKALPNTGANYYVMWDFAGIKDESVSEDTLKKATAEGGKWADFSKLDRSKRYAEGTFGEPWNNPIDPNGEINTGIVDQILAAQTDSDAKPNLNDPSVVSAKQKLDQVKSDAETKLNNVKNQNVLDQINSDYTAKINTENDRYHDQLKQIKDQRDQNLAKLKTAYDNKLAQIKALPESINELKAQLNQKLDDLKNTNAQKLAELKKAHEAKLQALAEEHQAEINDIKADLNKQVTDYKQQLADKHSKDNQGLVDQINVLQSKLTSQKAQLDKQLVDLKAQHQTEYDAIAAKLAPKQATKTQKHYDAVSQSSDRVELSNRTVILPATKVATANTSIVHSDLNGHSTSKTLPQTGNNSTLGMLLLGAATAMFGFGLVSKKRVSE